MKHLAGFHALARGVFSRKRWLRQLAGYYLRPPRQTYSRASSPSSIQCDSNELGRFVWRRLLPEVGCFPYPPHELMLMCAAATWLRPKLIIEWGTNVGASARVWWEVVKRYRIDTQIHSIDLPASLEHFENPGSQRGMLVRGLDVTLHEGDGADVACRLISGSNTDDILVFIDGDHATQSVFREGTEIWKQCPNAAILFHDTYESLSVKSGPREAVRQLLAARSDDPVIYETQIGHPGMTLVIPRCSTFSDQLEPAPGQVADNQAQARS